MRNEVDVMFIMLIYQLVNFRNLTEKTGKNYRVMSKELNFGQNYMKFDFAMDT